MEHKFTKRTSTSRQHRRALYRHETMAVHLDCLKMAMNAAITDLDVA